jgi:hypothetical protein
MSPVVMLWTAPPRHESAIEVGAVDADGSVVVRRQLKRRYVLTFFKRLIMA